MGLKNYHNGISVESDDVLSDIVVRESYNPLAFGRPVAVIKCGECNNKYKKDLFYQRNNYFCSENENLTCPSCNHTDVITYRKKR